MSKVYKNQTALQLNFSMTADITGYSEVRINIRKPQGSTTALSATVVDASTGSIYIGGFTTTTLDLIGKYHFQPVVTFPDGTAAKAETVMLKIWDEYE